MRSCRYELLNNYGQMRSCRYGLLNKYGQMRSVDTESVTECDTEQAHTVGYRWPIALNRLFIDGCSNLCEGMSTAKSSLATSLENFGASVVKKVWREEEVGVCISGECFTVARCLSAKNVLSYFTMH